MSSDNITTKIAVIISEMGRGALCELEALPSTAVVLGIGASLQDLIDQKVPLDQVTVLLNQIPSTDNVTPVIEHMPSLRWVHSMPSGVEYLQIPQIVNNPDIMLSRSRGIFAPQLAEYVFCACLYFAKYVPRLVQQQHQRAWSPFAVKELTGASIGIVGYGDIGIEVAKRAKACGMQVHALRRDVKQLQDDSQVDVAYGNNQLNDIFAASDYIVLLLPLTETTRGIINRAVLSSSKKGQVFINIARGAVVDEEALIEALQPVGNLAGAALDVFETEPLPNESPLWNMKNVLISPHCMYRLENTLHKGVNFFVENCHRYAAGESICGLADK